MNVLVIPEDFRKDQYILEPIVRAMLSALGRPTAKVRVCLDPLLGGIDEAMKKDRIREILDRYRGMVQLFLLCVDRDGKVGRRQALDGIEADAEAILRGRAHFLAENAWQELEVWPSPATTCQPHGNGRTSARNFTRRNPISSRWSAFADP